MEEYLKQFDVGADISNEEKEEISKTAHYQWFLFGESFRKTMTEIRNEVKAIWYSLIGKGA